jgi:hypothetical protein
MTTELLYARLAVISVSLAAAVRLLVPHAILPPIATKLTCQAAHASKDTMTMELLYA